MTARRNNEGKIDLTLIPVCAQEEEARVWMHGEEKYGRDNWQKLWGDKTTDVVMASLLRHAYAILKGETKDEESGFLHAAHIRCNAAMLIYAHQQGTRSGAETMARAVDDEGDDIIRKFQDGSYYAIRWEQRGKDGAIGRHIIKDKDGNYVCDYYG